MAQAKLVSNICGGITKSNLARVGLGESLNMYPEVQSTEHTCSILMRTISGEVKAADIEGQCRGMYRVSRGIDNKPTLYAVYDDTLWLIDSKNRAYEIGKIDSFGTEVHMTETGGYGSAHPHLICVDGTSVYAVNTGLSVGDQQSDFRTIELPLRVNTTDQVIKPTHCAYLYGYLIVNDAGTDAFYTSYQYPFEIEDTEDPSFYEDRDEFIDWWMSLTDDQRTAYKNGDISDGNSTKWKKFIDGTANDQPEKYDLFRVNTVEYAQYGFITYSEWSADNTIALCSNGKALYTLGERSHQIFSYTDDKNNPFSSPNSAAGNIGIKAPDSLAIMGDRVFWLGSSDLGEDGVFMLVDREMRRISTNDLEREISKLENPEKAYSSIWQEHQHLFYSLTFEKSKKTYVYDVTEDAWHYRASYDEDSRLTFWRYNHATFSYGHVYVGTKDALAYMDENKYTEHDGRVILKMRRGSALMMDGRPFYVDCLELIGNQGQHSFDDHYDNMELNPRISFRTSWDGSTWSDYEDAYFGKIGEYEYRTALYNLGLGRTFTLEISTTESIPFAIENLNIQFSPCSSFC